VNTVQLKIKNINFLNRDCTTTNSKNINFLKRKCTLSNSKAKTFQSGTALSPIQTIFDMNCFEFHKSPCFFRWNYSVLLFGNLESTALLFVAETRLNRSRQALWGETLGFNPFFSSFYIGDGRIASSMAIFHYAIFCY